MSVTGRTGFDIKRVVIAGFKRIRKPLTISFERQLNILVGDNGAGKSTILEAVHLALTGQYRGEPIRRALSQSLFNNDDIVEFIARAKDGSLSVLPEIRIEIFLSGDNDSDVNEFSGAVNSTEQKACGFRFSIAFDERYREELESLPPGDLRSLPIEYYDVRWTTFADSQISPRLVPIRSVMINPAGEWRSGRADEHAVRILLDGLDNQQQMALAQSARTVFDAWNAVESLQDASKSFPFVSFNNLGDIDIVADYGTSDSWKRNLVVRLESVPYSHIGAGSQSMIQASMALDQNRPAKTTLLLFEEPENHLSHTNLNRLIHLISNGADGRKIVITTHSSYVANVLGLENLQIVGTSDQGTVCKQLNTLSNETLDYFKKLPGYDTLRLVLASSGILVEGPSDELIVQLAYRKTHDGRLPVEDGIDIISVGSGFLRFLELAYAIRKRVLVLTDNDGKPEALEKKYKNYSSCRDIKISYIDTVYPRNDPNGVDPVNRLNWNTLEAEILRVNGLKEANFILGKSYEDEAALLKFMENNKTETALKFFTAYESVVVPQYIKDGLEWLGDGQ